jgi:hypothetical protein
MNYRYAQLKHNKVLQVVDTDYPMEDIGEGLTEWIEVSNANPQPQPGWRLHQTTGLFGPATEETILFEAGKEEAARAIDIAAGHARVKHITDIPGQAEVYREKYEQALDFLSTTKPVRYHEYPLLEIEREILLVPMKDIAENVVKRRSEWMTKISAIESVRLSGKHNLQNCSTIAEVAKLKALTIHRLTELA